MQPATKRSHAASSAARAGRTRGSSGEASGGAHLFFTPPSQDAWLEVPFEVPEDGRYVVKVDLTRSWDYGRWEIALDGKKVGAPAALRSPSIVVAPQKLGTHRLEKGVHTLRFTCAGRDPEARNKETGEPGYFLGVDRIYFRKVFPRT